MVGDENDLDEFIDQNGKVAKKGDYVVFGQYHEVYCGKIIKCYRREVTLQMSKHFTRKVSLNSFRYSVIINKNIVWLFKK
mgnify:CR=1 FL=1